jgi:hypothetical protein
MSAFEAKMHVNNVENILELSGDLDEHSQIPTFKERKNIRINMGKVTSINSYGVKIWCTWMASHKDWDAIIIEEAPFVFIRHISSVRGFISPIVTILSFYVPYFSDETQERKDVLFLREREFTKDGSLKIPEILDSKGQKMELDVIESSYFAFLKK